ncbi:MAG: tetratricopeptide repeat protein [Planctomycetota bacterium]|nr:tetratricopeptide repeat protein [Planctomycetota bacterium]
MAKKKRLNKKVIIILALIGGFILAGGFGVWLWRQPGDPQVYASRAAALREKGEYKAAVYNYNLAIYYARESDPQKPKYMLILAETLLEWNRKDKSLGDSTRSRNFGEARAALQKATLYDPGFVEAQRLLTELEYAIFLNPRRPDYKAAIGAVNKLLDLVPDDPEVLFKRARLYEQLAEDDTAYIKLALEDFKKLVKLAPDQDRYWFDLVHIHLLSQDADRFEQAEKVFKQALQANKDSARIRISYAQFLLQRDRKPEALELLDQAVKVRPSEATGYLALAMYHRREQDLDRAVANLEKAIDVEPADYRGYTELARIYIFRYAQSEAEGILKKGLDAIKKSKKPEMKDAELRNYHAGIVILNHRLCDVLLDSEVKGAEREKAIQAVRDRLKEMQKEVQDAGQDDFLFRLIDPYVAKVEGRLALIDDKTLEAEKLLRRAYDSFITADGSPYLEPKTAQLLINLYRQLGLHGEAKKIIDRLDRLTGGTNPAALMAMATVCIESRQYEQAQRMIRTMLEQNRNESLVSIQVGLDAIMGRSNRIPRGLKNLDPLAVQLFQRRAQQLWLEGEQESAIQLLSDILVRQPKNLWCMMKLIQWHQLRGESDRVNEILTRAREAYKDDPSVQNQLDMLIVTDRDKLLEQLVARESSETDPVRRALQLAGIYRAFGREKQFLEQLSAAEAGDPQNPGVIRLRFGYAAGRNDWATAEKYADAAAKIDLDTVGGRILRAQVSAGRGKIDDAIDLLQESLRIRPRFSQAHTLLGNCYLTKGQIDQAREQYESAYSQNPSNVGALVGMIRVSLATHNTAEYNHWVELAYKFAPQNSLIREAYLRLKDDPKKIIKYREGVRSEEPNNLTNLSYLAMLYESTGRLPQAEQTLRDMISISGGAPATIKALTDFLHRRNRDVEARGILAEYAEKATDKVVAYLLWAEYLDAIGETDQAKTVYHKAIAADPKDARGYLGVAKFAARHGQWTQAVDNQQKYIDIIGERTPPSAWTRLIAYMISADNLDEAEKQIDQRLQQDRLDVEMLTLKATIYTNRKDYKRAIEILDRALKIRDDYIPALVSRAEAHWLNRNSAGAIADLESARRAGAAPAIVVLLANRYESINDINNALSVLQNLLAEHPENAAALKSLAGLYGRQRRWSDLEKILADGKKAFPKDPFFLLAEANMWRQENRNVPSKTVAAYDEALKLLPGNVEVAFLRMQALVEAERYDEALSAGKSLRDRKDIAPEVMSVMALAHAKAGNGPAAESEFSAAVKDAKSGRQLSFVLLQIRSAYKPAQAFEKLNIFARGRPNDAQVYQSMGEILVKQKDLKGSTQYFEKALTNAKTDVHKVFIMGRLGLVYSQLGQHDTGLRIYQDALEIRPDDPGILNNLAWLLAHEMKKPDQALPYSRKACQLAPDNAILLDTLGYVLMLNGKYDEAVDVLSRSIDKQAMPANRLHLGQVYEKMKQSNEALRQYQLGWELLKGDPGNKYYRQFSEAIKRLGGAPGGSIGQ